MGAKGKKQTQRRPDIPVGTVVRLGSSVGLVEGVRRPKFRRRYLVLPWGGESVPAVPMARSEMGEVVGTIDEFYGGKGAG